MNKQAGLWIDHRKAVIVLITDEGEEVQKIVSGMDSMFAFRAVTHQRSGRLKMCGIVNLETILMITTIRSLNIFAMWTPFRYLDPVKQKVNSKNALCMKDSRGTSSPLKPWIK